MRDPRHRSRPRPSSSSLGTDKLELKLCLKIDMLVGCTTGRRGLPCATRTAWCAPCSGASSGSSRFLRPTASAPRCPVRKSHATLPQPKLPWSASTSCSSAMATSSSATSAPPISAWKNAIRSFTPPTSVLRRSPRMPPSSSRLSKASFPRRSFCVSLRRSARPTRRTTWSTPAGIQPPRTRIPNGPSRPSWCCRSGTPTASATTRSAPSSIAWESRRCACPCLTTTFAAPQSWSGRGVPAGRRGYSLLSRLA